MAQDTALLRYLLKWARRAPGSWSQRDLAFAFDWTNDYISSNATIGRTGYDMNVSGNVSTGSDGDGSYIQFNGNRDHTAWTWTQATIGNASLTYTQIQSFTIKCKFKIISSPVNNTWWIFGSYYDACIYLSSWNLTFMLRWSTNVQINWPWYSLNTLYDAYLVYDAVAAKVYCYYWISWGSSTLINAGGTTSPATFTADIFQIWDSAIWWWNATSSNKYIYHAAIRNKALTQAEIDADIALWNTVKNDPSIVAYYIPDNLTYNTQYLANPKALDQSPRSYTWATVTADTDTAPDWTTTADNIVFWAATHRLVQQTITAVTWSSLASKTFIIKAFVKCTAWTQTFRFRMDHAWVDTNQYSSDFTATTTRQEFTFTRTLTSSTSWTWLFCAVGNNSAWTAQTIQVRNVRLYLVNETLRDESPNIWGYLWWKQNRVLSCWCKPWKDAADNTDAQNLFSSPRVWMHIRASTNNVYFRYENTLAARSKVYTLWAWFRGKVHVAWVYYRDTPNLKRELKLYINGVSAWAISWTPEKQPPSAVINTALRNGRKWSTYYQGNIRDIRAYTFTWSFTDADALAIYNGGEPTSTWITKYLHYRPPVGEVGTTTQDQSPNDRDWTLNNWVTRDYI